MLIIAFVLLNKGKKLSRKRAARETNITWTFECVSRLKKDKIEAHTAAKWSLYPLHKCLFLHKKNNILIFLYSMNLSTENILIWITNPYIVKPNIPFLLVKKTQQIQQSYVLESYQHVLEMPIYVATCISSLFPSVQSSILFDEYNQVCLSIYMLTDIWILASSGLLWMMILGNSYRTYCG